MLPAGTLTLRLVDVFVLGMKGPVLIGPEAVETKKLTSEPGVKPVPFMRKLAPTRIGSEMLPMNGCPGIAVAVGVAIGDPLGVGVAMALPFATGVADGVAVGTG